MEVLSFQIFIWFFLALLLFVFEGFFSGSEMAFISVDPIKARQDPKIHFFVKHPDKLLVTTLLGTNLCVVANSAIFTYVLGNYFGYKDEYITIAIVSPLVLVFGETIPKTIARSRPYAFSKKVAVLFSMVYYAFSPFTSALLKLMRFFGQESLTRDIRLSREALSLIIEREANTEIEETEKELIQRIMDLRNIRAREVMKPIVQVMALEENDTVEKAVRLAKDSGYTRFPVYSKHIYNINKILNVFSLLDASLSEPVALYAQDAYFVPEFKNVWSIFLEMQAKKQPICVVVDEFGAALGIITVEDILEEVVGEIEDEYDLFYSRGEKIVKIDDRTYEVSGDTELDILEEVVGISFPKEDIYETVSGLLMFFMEKIPSKGEICKIGNAYFLVMDADEKRIRKVRLEIRDG